jgi:ankyrin repeat protein
MRFIFCLFLLWGCGDADRHEALTHEVSNPLVANGRWSALHEAVVKSNHARVKQLVEKGCDVNVVAAASSDHQVTPLILASKMGDMDIFETLVQAGADLHLAMSTGETALHLAVRSGDVEMVRRLVALGAQPDQESFYTESPIVLAQKANQKEILKALRKE